MLDETSLPFRFEPTHALTVTRGLPARKVEAPGTRFPGSRLGFMIAVTLFGLAIDQGTKAWAFALASGLAGPREVAPGFVAPVPARNYGAVAHLAGVHALTPTICALNVLIMFGVAVWWSCRRAERWRIRDAFFFGLVFAGMVGNSIDRLALGYVRDFLVITVWPIVIFNLADVFIMLGFLLLLGSWAVARVARPSLGRGAIRVS